MIPRASNDEDRRKWVGQPCQYFDQYGRPHAAIITQIWGMDDEPEGATPGISEPTSVNVVIVSDDESQTDQYGRQIKRETSVVCKAQQAAHGRYFVL